MTRAVLTKEKVEEFVSRACRDVENKDSFLLDKDVSEWAIAHRLAVYIEKYFPEYNIDCEYNRMADADGTYSTRSPKRVHGTAKERPDIIVHRRGPGADNNLLVIELKKNQSDDDENFLDAMMADPNFSYKYGCHVLITNEKLTEKWVLK